MKCHESESELVKWDCRIKDGEDKCQKIPHWDEIALMTSVVFTSISFSFHFFLISEFSSMLLLLLVVISYI